MLYFPSKFWLPEQTKEFCNRSVKLACNSFIIHSSVPYLPTDLSVEGRVNFRGPLSY